MGKGVAEVLKDAIRSDPRSLRAIGEAAGVEHAALSRFLRGERDLTLAAAGRLCQALGLRLARRAKRSRGPTDEQ